MNKKAVIIMSSVVAVCGLGVISSYFLDWPVDSSEASGDIAKSVRFSRQEASEKLTNMEELLQADSAFKNGIVAAQVVMQTRAAHFASLVEMSNEVAGNIPAFADVLNDMNKAVEVVTNANNSLAKAGEDLDAALVGQECPDLEQNTINGAMAYTTLQKQNKLADKFIEVTDKYLETAKGDDRLKLVRDQWLEYQQMTAALNGDKEVADALAKKGNLLTAEKTIAALASFGPMNQMSVFNICYVSQQINVPTGLGNQIPQQMIEQVVTGIQNAAGEIQKMNADNPALKSQEIEVQAIFNTAAGEVIAKAFTNATSAYGRALGESYKEGLNQAQRGLSQTQRGLGQTQRGLGQTNKEGLNQVQRGLSQTQRGLGQVQRGLGQTNKEGLNQAQRGLSQTNKDALSDLAVIRLASAQNVVSAFDRVVHQTAGVTALQQTQGSLSNTIGNVIQETSIGQRAKVVGMNEKTGL